MVSRHLRIDAEAAAWIARLQSSDRSEATEAGLKAWLNADLRHRDAFERATEIWGIIPGAVMAIRSDGRPATKAAPPPPRPVPRRRALALAAVAAALMPMMGGGAWWWLTSPVSYSTQLGEQQVATLTDGTRIALNTDTLLHVAYDKGMRRVRLDRGEAMFEVAHNRHRPFVVTAGDETVTAVGTSFIVRRTGPEVIVTLIEGKVLVAPKGGGASRLSVTPTMLSPGERLTMTADAPSLIDQPSIEATTAWRRGQAIFTDMPLSAAVAELNRYGGPPIEIDDPRLASLKVSGVFATSDTADFADAIASLHGLHVEHGKNALRIVH